MVRIFSAFNSRTWPDSIALHSIMMIGFNVGVGAVNYLFNLVMSILLNASDYSSFYSLMATLEILSVIAAALHTSVTRYTSIQHARRTPGGVKAVWKYFLKRAIIIGLLGFIVLSVLSPVFSGFLNLSTNWYVMLLASSFVLMLVLPINYGVLRGLQRFIPMGGSSFLGAILRLGIGVLLVYIGWGVYGGLVAHFLTHVLVIGLTLYFLKDVSRAPADKVEMHAAQSYIFYTMLALAAFNVLTNVDVILAKHYLDAEVAGSYAVIAVLGKIVYFLPGGIVIVMFPQTSKLHESGASHLAVLMRATVFTLLLAGGITGIYWLFPELILDILYGGKYASVSPFLFKYGLAMTLFALSFLVANYFLSINKTRIAFSAALAMALQVVLIIAFHADINQIVNSVLISAVVSVVLTTVFSYFAIARRPQTPSGV
ncbi:MAG: oligosaccharide flippase family protein [Chloroflexi bacterium]|nr:oligosaccharide flippase family protein [Chloroflexota bacterium]